MTDDQLKLAEAVEKIGGEGCNRYFNNCECGDYHFESVGDARARCMGCGKIHLLAVLYRLEPRTISDNLPQVEE